MFRYSSSGTCRGLSFKRRASRTASAGIERRTQALCALYVGRSSRTTNAARGVQPLDYRWTRVYSWKRPLTVHRVFERNPTCRPRPLELRTSSYRQASRKRSLISIACSAVIFLFCFACSLLAWRLPFSRLSPETLTRG